MSHIYNKFITQGPRNDESTRNITPPAVYKKSLKIFYFFANKVLTKQKTSDIISRSHDDLGVAQLVARYLGVVEAASSSLVTQTRIGGSTEPPIFFYFLAKSLEISRFRNITNGLVIP